MSEFYGQDFTGSFTGMPGSEGSVPYSVNVDTSKLESAMGIFQNALHQVTNMLGRVVSGVQTVGSTVGSVFSSGSAPPIAPSLSSYQGAGLSEIGRYVGSPTYFQSMMGAAGIRKPAFMPASDYQEMMGRDFAERTTLLGGSVASVGAEMGAGYLGSKLLKPLFGKGMFGTLAGGMTGYMAAAYPLQHIMGKVNEGFEFDKLIGGVSSRSGINEGFDQGFNRGSRREITKNLRGAGKELNLGMGDFADIMQYGGESGMFRGVTDSEQFTKTITVAAKNLKSLMRVLREPDVSEAIKDMATFQQWGIPLAEQSDFAQKAAVTGRMLGITAKGAVQIAGAGAQMGPQLGYSMAYGSEMGMFGATVGESMLRSKTMTRAEMSMYGGVEGYGQHYAQGIMKAAGSPPMKNFMAAMQNADGSINKERLADWESGKLTMEDIRKINRDRVNDPAFKDVYADTENFPQTQAEKFDDYVLPDAALRMGQEVQRQFPNMGKIRAYSIPFGGDLEAGRESVRYEKDRPKRLKDASKSWEIEELHKAKAEYARNAPLARLERWTDDLARSAYKPIDETIDYMVYDVGGRIKEGMKTVSELWSGQHEVEFPSMPDVPEDIKSSPDYQRRLESEYKIMQDRAKKSDRKVPFEIMDEMGSDMVKWSRMLPPGNRLYSDYKEDPETTMRSLMDDNFVGPGRYTEMLSKLDPDQLQMFKGELGVNLGMAAKHKDVQGRLGLHGRNVPGGYIAENNPYEEQLAQLGGQQYETTTYGAKDTASQQVEVTNKSIGTTLKLIAALDKNTAAQKPAWAQAWDKLWGNPVAPKSPAMKYSQ